MPKLSMRTEGGTRTEMPAGNPAKTQVGTRPVPAPAFVAPAIDEEDPFADVPAPSAQAGNGRADIESMLVSTREVIRALEFALEKAKQNERSLAEKLGRL